MDLEGRDWLVANVDVIQDDILGAIQRLLSTPQPKGVSAWLKDMPHTGRYPKRASWSGQDSVLMQH
jgi:hypothetical protein